MNRQLKQRLRCRKETRKAQTDAEDTGVELTTEEAVEATAAIIHKRGNLPIENANIYLYNNYNNNESHYPHKTIARSAVLKLP